MKHIQRISAGAAIAAFLLAAGVAYAATDSSRGHGHAAFGRTIVGTVASINGSELTINVVSASTSATVSESVDGSNARVLKSGATTTLSSIQIGDRVAVIGTVSGATVTATTIIDGVPARAIGPPGHTGGRKGSGTGRPTASSTRPQAFGSVQSISGDTFTVAVHGPAGTTTITVTADAATTFREGTTTVSISSLAVGNLVAVSGTSTSDGQVAATTVVILPKFPEDSHDHFESRESRRNGTSTSPNGKSGQPK